MGQGLLTAQLQLDCISNGLRIFNFTYKFHDKAPVRDKGRVLSPEGTQGIYAPETADRKHSFCARQHLIFITPRRKTTIFLRRFLTILNRR